VKAAATVADRCLETGRLWECTDWRKKVKRECKERKDKGSQQCSQWREDRRRDCASWDRECCDWWPCSWACKVITWVCVALAEISSWACVAYVWVANVVCVAWAYISSYSCAAWKYIATAACLAIDVITSVINIVVIAIESVIGWIISAVAFVINLFLIVPILGRLVRWIWELILTIVYFLISLVDIVLWLIGIRPEKKLRVCPIILRDATGPVIPLDTVVRHLSEAVRAYREQANVRIVPTKAFHFSTAFSDPETPDTTWVNTSMAPVSESILSGLPCGIGLGWTDLGVDGSTLEAQASVNCFYSTWRRLLGYGAPVVVFYVKQMASDSGSVGCSAGPLTDWVVVDRQGSLVSTTAHETGHACNLWHSTDPNNLMAPATIRVGSSLDLHQILLVRASRHVTYF
jgi:hypothetical protein